MRKRLAKIGLGLGLLFGNVEKVFSQETVVAQPRLASVEMQKDLNCVKGETVLAKMKGEPSVVEILKAMNPDQKKSLDKAIVCESEAEITVTAKYEDSIIEITLPNVRPINLNALVVKTDGEIVKLTLDEKQKIADVIKSSLDSLKAKENSIDLSDGWSGSKNGNLYTFTNGDKTLTFDSSSGFVDGKKNDNIGLLMNLVEKRNEFDAKFFLKQEDAKKAPRVGK